tara:strand:- start:19614 stop:20132 length:519 start_codon:yes stop_codon:yes gene_type:complete
MSEGYGGTGLTEEQKKKYGDPDAKWWQASDTGTDQLKAGFKGGVEGGTTGASIGASIGSFAGPVGTAIGAAIGLGAGFLVGSIAGHLGYDEDAEQQRIINENKSRRKAEDAARAEADAAATASKSAGGTRIQALPPAPSDESVLMGSMPTTAGAAMPMDPYRRTVMNKFGWS